METFPIGLRPAVDRETSVIRVGADDGTRTRNRRFTKPLLYQLSYVGAQNHTAGGPVAPGNDRAQRPNGSSAGVWAHWRLGGAASRRRDPRHVAGGLTLQI